MDTATVTVGVNFIFKKVILENNNCLHLLFEPINQILTGKNHQQIYQHHPTQPHQGINNKSTWLVMAIISGIDSNSR